MVNSKEIIAFLDSKFPQEIKEEWDTVGSSYFFDKEIKKILISLDLTKDVLKYALENKFDFILNYHTFLFYKGFLKNTFEKEPHKKQMHKLIKKNQINVFSAHTNFDFLPNTGVKQIINFLKWDAHIESSDRFNALVKLEKATKFNEIINDLKNAFNFNSMQSNVKNNLKVQKIAILPGSAGIENLLKIKKQFKADLYITSDLKWNELLTVNELKLNLLIVPHLIEKVNCNYFKKILEHKFKNLIIEIKDINEFIYNL
ncbi:Nif3-like dinuclear metal center hexameric protein [Mesomycoplasma lagogenitalium]|uniref:GTP cyclohydrolase 1 type 2 homolog n=1 Tax=Mesomycoplasma lagogenitalium TaxID=171286 RepID=A0ABY8LUX3_9BACT|nr:Nif3-like dinuclear metal center hexameric protein [Mesomycoplasma lagogenitalium]WGI37044.1 Nif3-like dinuclear metal center hexameric protein [Mesomycoplasma lagogenitalium]